MAAFAGVALRVAWAVSNSMTPGTLSSAPVMAGGAAGATVTTTGGGATTGGATTATGGGGAPQPAAARARKARMGAVALVMFMGSPARAAAP